MTASLNQDSNPLADLPLLPRDDDGPVFVEPWQAQVFAVVVDLIDSEKVTREEWADRLGSELKEAEERGEYDSAARYYDHWIAALEKLVVDKDLAEWKVHRRAGHRRVHGGHRGGVDPTADHDPHPSRADSQIDRSGRCGHGHDLGQTGGRPVRQGCPGAGYGRRRHQLGRHTDQPLRGRDRRPGANPRMALDRHRQGQRRKRSQSHEVAPIPVAGVTRATGWHRNHHSPQITQMDTDPIATAQTARRSRRLTQMIHRIRSCSIALRLSRNAERH